jgi:pyruvate kinase
MAKDLAVDKMILIYDGKLQLKVKSVDVEKGIIKVKALNFHRIYEKRSINLSDSKYTMLFLSKKDKENLKFAGKHDLDYIALNFVISAQNIIEVKK